MKQLIYILIIGLLSSCSPGRWVPQNAKHMQQRHDAKERRDSIAQGKVLANSEIKP